MIGRERMLNENEEEMETVLSVPVVQQENVDDQDVESCGKVL